MPSDHTTAIELSDARVSFNHKPVWAGLDLRVPAGEFIAVLGPNGSGKTSLLQVLLGLQPLSHGSVRINGHRPSRGDTAIGYIPQQKTFDSGLPLRGRDLVRLGLDGHHYGWSRPTTAHVIDQVIEQVGAATYADQPVGVLSGGEQQRLRVAQALVSDPSILLCDEPLLSLDLASQRTITELIDSYRRRTAATVLFVTHEINPVLPHVDRILYVANGQWVCDTPDAVLQGPVLSKLYGTDVDVIRIHDHVHIIADEANATETGHHHHASESRAWN